MKKIYFVVILSFGLGWETFAQDLDWNFPILPKTEAWKKLADVNARIAACQIPTDYVQRLSTAKLVQLCIMHPFFLSYSYSNSPVVGFKNTMKTFNGYQELLTRSDALNSIAQIYANEDFRTLDTMKSDSEGGRFSLRIIGIELMMSHENLIARATETDKYKILKVVSSIHQKKAKYADIFGGFGEVSTAYLAMNVMKQTPVLGFEETKYSKNPNWGSFSNGMTPFDKSIVDEIISDFNRAVASLK